MSKFINIKSKIKKFDNIIEVPGDKSLSIRWLLFASLASGKSIATNLLLSEDVLAAADGLKKLGIKIKFLKNRCEVIGKGLNGYKFRPNLVLDAKNSGTFGRLILGLLVDAPNEIKLIGDKSLSKRDFKRISDPLKKFGVNIKLNKDKTLPLLIKGSEKLKPINYLENKGSAQCKSAVMLAALKTSGTTIIKAKKSRNHTELICKYLNLPVKIKNNKKFDLIIVKKAKKIPPFNYKIPSDISSSAFFLVLTALSKNSKLIIKNVNINPSRVGVVTILKKMGVNINFLNKKKYKGELIADIYVESAKKIKPINCPTNLNSGAIDEFLLIFLVAAKAEGVSTFKSLEELNQKESPRLNWGSKILSYMGVKNILTSNSIKIFGDPALNVNNKITIKNYLKDHRVFMASVIAALTFGGNWKINDKDSIKTSFPSFLKTINFLKNDKKKKKYS
jgi:3-phosphoshikimate 1-carboxyvinyltransferase